MLQRMTVLYPAPALSEPVLQWQLLHDQFAAGTGSCRPPAPALLLPRPLPPSSFVLEL